MSLRRAAPLACIASLFFAAELGAAQPSWRFDWAAAKARAAAEPAAPGQPADTRHWSLSGAQRSLDFSSAADGGVRWPWRRLWPSLSDYQIGDEWGKIPVTARMLREGGGVFQRAAKATAAYGGATAFYLGKFNGRHIVATNHHVSGSRCKGKASFPLLDRAFPCEKVYGDWPEVDLALFSIKTTPADEALLIALARNFAFDAAIYPGQLLLTIGFGVADNSARALVANQDNDCKVFSQTGDFRLMADPDEINPGSYKTWSFSNGCDVSHGDSGSAFIDRRTGDVLGIVWTGKFPKAPSTGSSAHLAGLIGSQNPEVWGELTLTVPAAKIRESIRAEIDNASSDDQAKTLSAIIAPAASH